MRNLLIILATIIFIGGPAEAQSLLAYPVGEYWQFGNARSLSMAGSGAASTSGTAALMLNPAVMSQQQAGWRLQFSPTIRNTEERRSFPVFNRIDDIVQQGIYALNDNWYLPLQGGAQFTFDRDRVPFLRSIAIGVFDEINQNYDYFEEVRVRDFDDEKNALAYNEIVIDGKLTRLSFGAAVEVIDKLSAGLQIGVLRGDLDYRQSTNFYREEDQSGDQLFEQMRKTDNTPLIASFGLLYEVTPHFQAATDLQLPYQVDYNSDAGKETIEYPARWTLGFEYRGRQELQSRLNVDFSYEWWNSRSYSIAGADVETLYEDVIVIKPAVEHIFYNQIPLRVGLQYRTSFQNRTFTRTLVSGGTGFMGEGWQVDVAGAFTKQSYPFPDLFDDALFGGDRSRSEIDTVEEKYFFAMITLTVGR